MNFRDHYGFSVYNRLEEKRVETGSPDRKLLAVFQVRDEGGLDKQVVEMKIYR